MRETTIRELTEALDRAELLVKVRPEEPEAETVLGITYDSREIEPCMAFVCKGAHFNEDYLNEAIEAGAACYVTGKPYGRGTAECPEIMVSDIRKSMPVLARYCYGRVDEEISLVGVTGTKGKSTTTYYMRYILDDCMAANGEPSVAICSGIENYDGVITEESCNTTPEILELYRHMDNAVSEGIGYLVMEVSSQALKYDRVSGLEFEAGAFLNISTDHISSAEHKDFDDYLESKLRLFRQCRTACINLDCDEQERIREAARECPYVTTFSQKDSSANIYAYDISSEGGHVRMRVRAQGIRGYDFDEEFELGTFGTINVENALAAISLSALLGIPVKYMQSGLAKAVSPGRMEVFTGKGGTRIAIVDFAHNKLSFEKFFETIREEFPGKKIISVFGAPGGKALARRAEMGELAGANCEYCILTEDDPGEEDVNEICREIGRHVEKAGGKFEIVTDRAEAIRKAIAMLDDDTLLFIPGKGREARQKRGTEYVEIPSDVETVSRYIDADID